MLLLKRITLIYRDVTFVMLELIANKKNEEKNTYQIC